MASFYYTLPSNSSEYIFQENTQSSYKVKINKQLPITQGKWEVGLSDIQFPKSWYNVTGAWMRVRLAQNSDPFLIRVKDGYYKDIEELVAEMHQGLGSDVRFPDKISFRYDRIANRVIIVVLENSDQSPIGVSFSQNLLNVLGFSESKKEGEYFSQGVFVDGPTDINEGFSALYVYSDVIENQFVGGYMVPLLQIVPFKNDGKRHNTWVTFNPIQYLPILDNQADSIEINIKRDNGKLVPFQGGKVVVKLHFRKTK